VGGASWSPAFRAALAAAAIGSDRGFALPEGTSAATLPWVGVNQITLRFDKSSSITQGDLLLTGVASAGLQVASFAYDAATLTATWTLDRPLPAGQWRIGTVGGAAASARSFALDILPGDVNRSGGAVNASDLVSVRNAVGRTAADPNTFDPFKDVNGDGVVNAADLVIVRNRIGVSLPPSLQPSARFSVRRIAPARHDEGDIVEIDAISR
jgi:hypothetical protein